MGSETCTSQTEVRLSSMTLSELFAQPLRIPPYQRDYAWQPTHVMDLLNDILARSSRPQAAYLMGTVILHEERTEAGAHVLDVVDGQQRLVTLTILLQQIGAPSDSLPLLRGEFSGVSASRIRKTLDTIRSFLQGKTGAGEQLRTFLDTRRSPGDASTEPGGLLFSVLTMSGDHALDRAYTFFDSVNSKGMPLTDFDLLKAHHLMFIPPAQETLATRHNDSWQLRDDTHAQVFSLVLRRLRMWNRGLARDPRGERPDYAEFCSVVEPEEASNGEHTFNRYMQPAAFRSWRRVNDQVVLSMDYPSPEGEALLPTEVTQTIEGGDAFFIYAERYHRLHERLYSAAGQAASTDIAFVRGLADHMDNSYLRNAFQAVMLLYFDKFGEERLIEAAVLVERLVSAYRWSARSVRIEGTLTHVKERNLVPALLNAFNARHAVAQLHKACGTILPPQPPSAGVQLRYFGMLKTFYDKEQCRIPPSARPAIAHFHVNP